MVRKELNFNGSKPKIYFSYTQESSKEDAEVKNYEPVLCLFPALLRCRNWSISPKA